MAGLLGGLACFTLYHGYWIDTVWMHALGAASQGRGSAAADACGRRAPGGQQVPAVLDPCVPGGQRCMGDRRAARAQCSARLLH